MRRDLRYYQSAYARYFENKDMPTWERMRSEREYLRE